MTVSRLALIVTLVLLLMPPPVAAQPTARIPRIGILSPAPIGTDTASPFTSFRDALRGLGYVEGKDIKLEFRLADGKFERLRDLADELVRLQVDVIVTDGGDAVTLVAANATRSIPIVFGTGSDPVASGLVTSLARPGGNVTGFTLSSVELAGKRLQLIKEIVPAASRVVVLWDASASDLQFRATVAVARSLGVKLESLPVHGPADLDERSGQLSASCGLCRQDPEGRPSR